MPTFNLADLAQPEALTLLKGIRRGIEKEGLRVSPEGELAQTDHPRGLGSALTHDSITTDFAEALLEFITPPVATPEQALEKLDQIHRYTYSQIGDERLWVNSMPGRIGRDPEIPVARYGSSHSGTMKTIYRLGLGLRYGRAMQTIAGIHYNFSLPDTFWQWLQAKEAAREGRGETAIQESLQDFKTRRYFDLIRNFRRHYWLLIYLFGAAPAVCGTFVQDREHKLQPFDGDGRSLYAPQATSLRMGDLGYTSDAQKSLIVCYNDLSSYLSTLCAAISRPYPPYHELGVKDENGEYQQLSTGLLQIENEFYSPIRPKNPAGMGETALSALDARGVEYIEVRCLDLNPFIPLGIEAPQMRFLDAFLLHCLLSDSPMTDDADYRAIQQNQARIVYQGRDPEVQLIHNGSERKLTDWAGELLDEITPMAELLDQAWQSHDYTRAVAVQRDKIEGRTPTPAAQMLAEMHEHQQTFFQWAQDKAEQHRQYFLDRPLSEKEQAEFEAHAKASLQKQSEVEASDQGSFEDFLGQYYAQYTFCQKGL
ncbi:glutamate--cysteine ligase [Microbulbifer hydrolyticus]|uniref:Glutamate--cysteine ligase n=1 Tax=Microbulbifer hydrolyticus TaxID=48074 RepID=A0A6P1T7Z3_9GAMM|nr:glutamate--cysteine ligase [Microbulbifer hydrolyticus]MBB5211629.1 glutamate--cysteine ligase [Microbulbifer hydrolyticus]QHQ37636.1 glutamate--cysteine ligase [Microbulbifer hydrolyticus]